MSTIAVTSITVKLVYLARLREAFASSGESLALPAGSTVRDVVAMLRGRGEPFARELAQGRAVRVAVNHELASPAVVVGEGDEIALLPPVTGG